MPRAYAAHAGTGMRTGESLPAASRSPLGWLTDRPAARRSSLAVRAAVPYVATAIAQLTAWRRKAVCVQEAQYG